MPITLEKGQQHARLIGFQAVSPPKRVTRSRKEDMLILFLTTSEKDRLSEELQQTWLDQLTDAFYKTSGSVTSALRMLIEKINLTLMERNFKGSPKSGTMSGALNAAALHNDYLYIAQSGLTHAYVLTSEGLQHFTDRSQSDRGLGLSRTPSIRYFQAEIKSNGYLFMADNPPSTYREDLLLTNGLPNPEQLKRRLLNQAPASFELGLVQIKPGSGNIVTLQTGHAESRPVEQVDGKKTGDEKVQPNEQDVKSDFEDGLENLEDTHQTLQGGPGGNAINAINDDIVEDLAIDVPIEEEQQEPKFVPSPPEEQITDKQEKVSSETQPQAIPLYRSQTIKTSEVKPSRISKKQKDEAVEKGLRGLAAFFEGLRKIRQNISTFFKDILARWSPQDQDGQPQLSPKTQLLIAVIVPLVVVAIAAGVYIGRGRTLQYESYFSLAEAKAANAANTSDPSLAREDWVDTLSLLDQAETYRLTNDTQTLRDQAQNALDQLDGAIRLRYHSALIGSLPESVNITRIIYYGTDLYLLDSAGGRVIHALGAGQGYQVDEELVCQGGSYNGVNIGALVDMVSLPPNNPYQAHILGVDSDGNVLYCAPGLAPIAQMLPSAGETAGGVIRAAYESNTLFVLNPERNTIYVYPSTNGQFIEPPIDYFGSSEPGEKPDISLITDLEVNGAKLYMLQSSGSIAECVYSGLPGDPVSCQNPVTYIDGRPGREEQAVNMPGSNFVAILYNPPPASSISILDANNADIYRLSQIFRLNRQLRPDMGDAEVLAPTATAFTIGMERVIFLAFGNQVFYAYVD
jgi:hypothetical protein